MLWVKVDNNVLDTYIGLKGPVSARPQGWAAPGGSLSLSPGKPQTPGHCSREEEAQSEAQVLQGH